MEKLESQKIKQRIKREHIKFYGKVLHLQPRRRFLLMILFLFSRIRLDFINNLFLDFASRNLFLCSVKLVSSCFVHFFLCSIEVERVIAT